MPLHHKLRSGDIVEIITSKSSRGPSRDWLGVVVTPRAKQKVRQYFRREQREDSEHSGRDLLQEMLRREGLPAQKILSAKVFQQIVKEVGYQKAEDLYAALGSGRLAARTVVNKILQRAGAMKEAVPEVAMLPTEAPRAVADGRRLGRVRHRRRGHERHRRAHGQVLQADPRRRDRGVHLAGQGRDYPSARLQERPRVAAQSRALHDRLVAGPRRAWRSAWRSRSRRSTAAICSRTWRARSAIRASTSSPAAVQTLPDGVVRDRFTIEVGDVRQLDNILANIRAISTVYDAYRVVAS